MKRRILSLFMVTVLLLISVSVGFCANAEGENLIKNGDFSEISNNLPTNWKANLKSGTTAEVVKNVSIAAGLNTTAIKFTTNTQNTARSELYYTGKVKIEKNTTYTTTFWVKSSTIAGFRAYMYEPTYINASGVEKTSATAYEGQNIYTYSYDNGSTRVIRTDVAHSWTIKETGTVIDKQNPTPSMIYFRNSGVAKKPAVDYPNETMAGAWVQIQHTFKTGNNAAHEAEISYSFAFPSVENGNIWFADVVMTAQKDIIDTTFTPMVNDSTLGTVSPSGAIELAKGTPTTITAEPFGENTFDGWYSNGVCVSTEPKFTFTYNGGDIPKYEAKFAKAEWGIDGGFETGYTNNQVLAQSPDVAYNVTDTEGLWTEDLFKSSSKDGNNKFFIDSQWSRWGKATITNSQAHTGSFSLKMSPNARFIGYRLENLTKNTNYTVGFYAMTTGTTDNITSTVGDIIVTDANKSCVIKNSSNQLLYTSEETGALAKTSGLGTDCKDAWKKFSIEFNSKESTDVIVWICPIGAGTQLYVDNYSIKRAPKKFKAASNNVGLGTVTPNDFIECRDGQSVTVTATPYPNAYFIGWYIGDELISKDADFTFNYEDKYQGLTAVFEVVPGIITNGHFENYENGQVLASYNNNSDPKFNNTPPWSVATTNRTDCLEITVTDSLAHWGKKSLLANIPYRYIGLDVEGLKPNTKYTLSFWAHITGSESTSSGIGQNSHSVSNAFILPKGKAAVVETVDSSGSISYKLVSSNEYLASIPHAVECLDRWKKIELPFTTTNVTDITLWLTFSGYQTMLYMDDFEICETTEVMVKAERGGSVTTNYTTKNAPIGKTFTATAIPYEGNSFIGWYDSKRKLVSASSEYSFTISNPISLIALFDGENMPEEEFLAKNGYDGTFENGTVEGWYFYDPNYTVTWCTANKTTAEAYEGNSSLAVNSRYRVAVLPLEKLYAHTNYTLSFYVKFPASDDKAEIPYIAVLPYNAQTPNSSGRVFDIEDTLTPSAEWQRVELSFNSESCTNMNFVLHFKTDSTSQSDFLFIDNLTLTCKEYTGPDRNISFIAGNINGDNNNNVNLLDLVTLAQYVAKWENVNPDTKALDVNGDSLVNLDDVVYFSRYLAGWKDTILSYAPYFSHSN